MGGMRYQLSVCLHSSACTHAHTHHTCTYINKTKTQQQSRNLGQEGLLVHCAGEDGCGLRLGLLVPWRGCYSQRLGQKPCGFINPPLVTHFLQLGPSPGAPSPKTKPPAGTAYSNIQPGGDISHPTVTTCMLHPVHKNLTSAKGFPVLPGPTEGWILPSSQLSCCSVVLPLPEASSHSPSHLAVLSKKPPCPDHFIPNILYKAK